MNGEGRVDYDYNFIKCNLTFLNFREPLHYLTATNSSDLARYVLYLIFILAIELELK